MTFKFKRNLLKNEIDFRIEFIMREGTYDLCNINYRVSITHYTSGKLDLKNELLVLSTPIHIIEYPGWPREKYKRKDYTVISLPENVIRTVKFEMKDSPDMFINTDFIYKEATKSKKNKSK